MIIDVQRKPLTSKELDTVGGRLPQQEKTFEEYKAKLKSKRWRWGKILKQYFPVTDWLFHYKFREDFFSDVVAGLTVAIMNIPQGMAYALLANVPPIYGIYTSIFPVIVYCIFGPSKHISMGTNPLTSILTASAINLMLDDGTAQEDSESQGWMSMLNPTRRSLPVVKTDEDKIMVGSTLALMVAIWQILFSIAKFGKLSWILSDVLVSGYTTGAAFHVLSSQLKGIFGVSLPEHKEFYAKFFLTVIDVFKQIKDTNWASVLIALICMGVLIVNDEFIKPRVAKRCSFPIPMQLIVVVFGTLFSFLFDFSGQYDVDIVGNITTAGFKPSVPSLSAEIFKELIGSSLIIAIVGYCVTLSMAKIFANRFAYKVDGNQEMLSEGLSNLVGCIFQCIPSGASMSRSSVQVAVGGRTQLTSIVSVAILGILFAFISLVSFPFEWLPKAVLSAIIVVALKGMFWQFKDLPKFYNRSKLDGALWIGSFLAVMLLDIDTGLVAGIGLSILVLLYRSIAVDVDEMGLIEDTSIFASRKEFARADRRDKTIILRVSGPITFANFDALIEKLRKKLKRIPRTHSQLYLVLDMSAVSYIDQSGGKAFKDWLKKDEKIYKKCLAACTSPAERMLLKLETSPNYFYPTLLDALAEIESGFNNSSFNSREASSSSLQDAEVKIVVTDAENTNF